MKTLFSLAEGIRMCTSCPLHKSRLLAVPGEGPEDARITIVGEAPGSAEDRVGLPFVGKSGKFLDEMLKIAGINRADVFVTGSVKCHPKNNQNPKAGEFKTCKELWLDKQIEIIKPRLIVILGRIALRSLLKEKSVKELHGKVIEKENQKYFITYHPAAAMRFPQICKRMHQDFQKLRAAMQKL